MSRSASIADEAPPSGAGGSDISVRRGAVDDVVVVSAAVRELLIELGGTPPPILALEQCARLLIDDSQAGAVLVARDGAAVIGVLCASWQIAMHVPGRYALIQDLWVHRSWRGRSVGSMLLAAIFELAREQRIERVEVGLPRERFARFKATEAFYLGNGFTQLGPRMRRILA